VKGPDEFARANVKRAHLATRAFGRYFGDGGSSNDQIFINGWRRRHRIFRTRISVRNSCSQIDYAVFSKIVAGFSGFRVQSDQTTVESAV